MSDLNRRRGHYAAALALALALVFPVVADAEWGQRWGVMIWGESVVAVPQLPDAATGYELSPSVPNPFNPETTIEYSLPEPAQVSLSVYSVTGQVVRMLERSVGRETGRFQVVWNGRDDDGRLVSPGVYFYVMDAGSFRQTRRMLLLR